jgi:hypothetical protein
MKHHHHRLDVIDPDQQNGQGQTPFFCATMFGSRDTVRELLLTGRINLESRDSSGCTPLIWVARAGLTEIMRDMLLTCEKLPLVNPPARILNLTDAEYVRVGVKTIYVQNKDFGRISTLQNPLLLTLQISTGRRHCHILLKMLLLTVFVNYSHVAKTEH